MKKVHHLYFQFGDSSICHYKSGTLKELIEYAKNDIDEKMYSWSTDQDDQNKIEYIQAEVKIPSWSKVLVIYHITTDYALKADYTLYID